MNKLPFLVFILIATIAAPCVPAVAEDVPKAMMPTSANEQTQKILFAATAFLDSLDLEQRAKALFPFVPQKTADAAKFKGGMGGRMTFVGEQYGQAVWSNFPVSDVPRPGLPLGSLSAGQREAAMHLLQMILSPKGYQKVLDVMGADQVLSEGGTQYSAGTQSYTLGIFGTPSATSPWLMQFGGHHLGLNAVIAGERGVLTPTLTGTQPAVYTVDGITVRVLAQENDKAFDLLHALDEGQRKQAILNYQIGDLVLGPGQDGKTIVPEGLKASAMTEPQRALLLDLIAEWAGILNEAHAAARLAEIKGGLDDTYFAWSGPTSHEQDKNGAAYYRIQGPKLVIEFSPQAPGGDLTMHVHTMYRDPTNDYGRAFTVTTAK